MDRTPITTAQCALQMQLHFIAWLIVGFLLCQPGFTEALDIQSSAEFYQGICSTNEGVLRVKGGFRIVEEPAELTSKIPCVVARNITVVGDLPDGSFPWVDFNFVRNKILIQPHVWFTVENLVASNFKYGGGGDFDIVAPSPNGIFFTKDMNKNAPFCVRPGPANVQNLRALPLPVGFPEFAGWTQSVGLDAVWCNAGGMSGVGDRCWNDTLTYDYFATYAVPNSDDIGSSIMAKIRSVKTCEAFISANCSKLLGNEPCIKKSIDDMLAARAAAEAGAGTQQTAGGSSSGLSSGAKAGIVVGSVVGGAVIIAAVLAAAVYYKRRVAGPAAGSAYAVSSSKGKDLEVGRGSPEHNSSNSGSDQFHGSAPGQFQTAGAHGTKDSFGFNTSYNFAAALGPQTTSDTIKSGTASSNQLTAMGLCEDGTAITLRLAEPLGAGSFGVVMRGSMGDTPVAVKIIAHDRQHADDVLAEVKLMMTFTHPNVLAAMHYLADMRLESRSTSSAASVTTSKLEEVLLSSRSAAAARASAAKNSGAAPSGSSGGRTDVSELWIISTYCEGGSLQQAARRGEFLTPARALAMAPTLGVLKDVAAGMAYLHARQVCHGDLKAQNVLLAAVNPPTGTTPAQGPWVAKVADFGLSRALKDDETHRSTRTTGTVTHMPPELLRSGKLMPAGDVYAFGMLMWEVATGRMPYQGLMYGEVVERVVVSHRRPAFPVFVPPAYAALARKCWAADPAARPTFAAVFAALEELCGQVPDLQAVADEHPGLDLTTPLPDADEPTSK